MNKGDNNHFRIAIISGKLGGVDGVSLEVDKWIKVLLEMGHQVFTIAGRYIDTVKAVPEVNQIEIPEISFISDFQKRFEQVVFPHISPGKPRRVTEADKNKIVDKMMTEGTALSDIIYQICKEKNIDVLIAQNTNAMPMTILGGVAIEDLVRRRRMAVIFHHHDFWWERSRFSNSVIEGLLNRIMPPVEPGIEHVVISSYAEHILRSFKRVKPVVVPNCEDFNKPVGLDDYNKNFRKEMGFKEDDLLIVQPTRIVPRKRIEDSIRLVGKLQQKYPALSPRIQYIISLYQGDELDEGYIEYIRELAETNQVKMHLISKRVASVRKKDKTGCPMFTNRDVLANADLVTMLPIWEGFGNALLETIAAKVPLVTTTYLVYKTDIAVTGVRNVEIRDQYDKDGCLVIPDKRLEDIYAILTDKNLCREIVEHNFEIGKKEFSFQTLYNKLNDLLEEYGDEIRASRKRLEKGKTYYSV